MQPKFLPVLLPIFLVSLTACKPSVVCPDFPQPELVSQYAKENNLKQKSGYLQGETGKLFYWFIEAQPTDGPPDSKTPVVVWLNGGPGSSSLIGMLMENGPFRVNPNLTLTKNPHSWHQAAHMLYIDQPVGTGYSIPADGNRFSTDEQQVAENFFRVLVQFYDNNKLLASNPLYLTGESFAGTYLPHMAVKILDFNKSNATDKTPRSVNLKGISIGDGTVDSLQSWKTQPQFALNNKLIGQAEFDYLQKNLMPGCMTEIQESRKQDEDKAVESCWEIQDRIVAQTGVNVYDIRRVGKYRFDSLVCYLNEPKVIAENGAKQAWETDNQQVFNLLHLDDDKPTTGQIQTILKSGLKVLIYNGNQDLIVNYLGTEAWLNALEYPDFQVSEDTLKPWKVADNEAGLMTSSENLTYVRILNAGHLVPMDQPATALALLELLVQP